MRRDRRFPTRFQTILAVAAVLCGCLHATASSSDWENAKIPLRNWPAPAYWMPTSAGMTAAPLSQGKTAAGDARQGSVTPLSGPLVFVGITPCRLVDTRPQEGFPAPFGAPAFAPDEIRSYPFLSHPNCQLPSNVKAFSLNLLILPPGPLPWLSAWPDGYPYPGTSFLNATQAGIYNNAVIVGAGVNGGISVLAKATTHLIIDINGYFIDMPASNSTLGGVVSASGTAQSLPPGCTAARAGTGQYVITFPPNTFPAGASPAPVLTPIGAVATLQGASVVRMADGSGTLSVHWSNDITFSFLLTPN